MKFVIKILISALAVIVAAYLLKGVVVSDYWYAILVAVVLTLLNITVRPLLILLTLPATILTLGLFLLVINAVVIMIADYFLAGFNVDGFWWALAFSLILSLVNSVFFSLLGEKKKSEKEELRINS